MTFDGEIGRMTNQQLIKHHLETVHRLASASGHSMLVYLVEMAMLENLPLKNMELEIDTSKQNDTDMAIMLDS